MKSIIETVQKPEIKFPCLMKYCGEGDSNFIILVTDEDDTDGYAGMVVWASDTWDVGEYDTCWAVYQFEPFDGTIKLSN